jgi:hypothetical protein
MANVWYSAIQRKLPISISTSFPILKTSNMLTKKEIYANCWFTPPGFVASVNDTVPTGIVDVSLFSSSFDL